MFFFFFFFPGLAAADAQQATLSWRWVGHRLGKHSHVWAWDKTHIHFPVSKIGAKNPTISSCFFPAKLAGGTTTVSTKRFRFDETGGGPARPSMAPPLGSSRTSWDFSVNDNSSLKNSRNSNGYFISSVLYGSKTKSKQLWINIWIIDLKCIDFILVTCFQYTSFLSRLWPKARDGSRSGAFSSSRASRWQPFPFLHRLAV